MNAERYKVKDGLRSGNRQAGMALIIALIFLLLMTLIGTTAMRSATMQERMAGNSRDWNLAFQSAEAALREAESYLVDTPVLPAFNNTNGFYTVNSTARPVWTGTTPSNGSGSITYTNSSNATVLAGTAEPPKYYFEQLSIVRPPGSETQTGTGLQDITYFRVTAVGYGAAVDGNGDPVASVVLSTVYRSH